LTAPACWTLPFDVTFHGSAPIYGKWPKSLDSYLDFQLPLAQFSTKYAITVRAYLPVFVVILLIAWAFLAWYGNTDFAVDVLFIPIALFALIGKFADKSSKK
jgi:hypothetical protein